MKNKLQILFWSVIIFVGITLAWTLRLEAQARKPLTEWTTQLVYDTTNVCYQGTIRWIVMVNPSLAGQLPTLPAQRQMLSHCFCVMDRIKKQVSIEEYQKKIYDENWVGDLFMSKALECVKEDQTLPSFFAQQGVLKDDNETKILSPEGKPEDSQELLPNQQEEELEGLPETIFQG